MYIIFPSNYLNKREVEPDYKIECDVAINNKLGVALFNQYLWDNNKEIEIHILQSDDNYNNSPFVYRGWMMKPEDYELFFTLLKDKDITLLADPEQYSNLHEFNKSYPLVKEDAPKTFFFESISEVNLDFINSQLQRFMVKDFVKSVKGTDFPEYFEQPSQEEFDKWMQLFVKYRGNLFTGGIQIKEYLDLRKYDDITNEYRVFYANEFPICIIPNSNQPEIATKLSDVLISKYNSLPSSFYTVDFIECKDGTFKVIETGDGGVSGLPFVQDVDAFYNSLQKEVMSLSLGQSNFYDLEK